MGKDNHANYYYTYTSPSVAPPNNSNTTTPSAPSVDEIGSSSSAAAAGSSSIAPPSYDDVLQEQTNYNNDHAQNKPSLTNNPYVRDDSYSNSIPAYNPANIPDADEDHTPLLNEHSGQVEEHQDPFRGRPPPPGYSIYRAPFETLKDGTIQSRDVHLNTDGEALLQFLKQRNTKPCMAVRFYGYHEETHWRTRSTRDKDGNLVEEREPVTVRVDDFTFDVDCSNYVSPNCEGMYVLPDKKTGFTKSVRELCDDYVHETNQLKELRLTKVIDWDYATLTRAFTAAIRNHGYYHSVEITFETKENKIIVKANTKMSRMVDNWMVRWFFFLSCLWILSWPILWLCRKKFGHNSLQSKWKMMISERDWYYEKVHEVLGQVRQQGQAFGTVPFIL
ncbi:hypothetical protein BDA99DRAFT_496305 [Phascolomyces articulosus]|uniref:Uncharacterized protein n=1 Tax=Phascolomyces articulosus TaxID=60185 RepID=A0AAD5PJ29_9FUNG|nr:hypothetical protein BDA99DRAFT_496305 [Phascolomyces articulosus]